MDKTQTEQPSNSNAGLSVPGGKKINIGIIGHVDHGKTTLAAAVAMALGGHTSWDEPFMIAGRQRRQRDHAETPLRVQTVDTKTEYDYARIAKAEERRNQRNLKRIQNR